MQTKKLFEVQYTDPETGERVTVEKLFDDSPEFPAKMWAEDYGYTKADKGWHRVRELPSNKQVEGAEGCLQPKAPSRT